MRAREIYLPYKYFIKTFSLKFTFHDKENLNFQKFKYINHVTE